jgi:hypothetical protein
MPIAHTRMHLSATSLMVVLTTSLTVGNRCGTLGQERLPLVENVMVGQTVLRPFDARRQPLSTYRGDLVVNFGLNLEFQQ